MATKKSFLIYSTSSKEDDFFFFKIGEVEEDDLEEVKSVFLRFKNLNIVISDISLTQLKSEIKKSNISSKYDINNQYITHTVFQLLFENIDINIFQLLKLESLRVSKNLLILEKYVLIISENSKYFWSNNKNNCTLNFENYKIVEDHMLYDFINEEYSKKCYGLQIPSESPYDNYTFESYLSSSFSPDFKRVETPFWCDYTFCIEKCNDEKESCLSSFPIKLRLFKFFDIHYKDNKNFKVIFEETLFFIGGYDYDLEKNIFYFIIEKSLFKKLEKIKPYISDSFCLNWIDENHFYNKFNNIKFEQSQICERHFYSIWTYYYLFGLVIRYKEFHLRYSDFGTDNSFLVVHGDSKYLDLINKIPVHVTINPRGTHENSSGEISSPGKYHGLQENVFDYFFENKKYLITSIDEIPYMEYSYSDYLLEGRKTSIVSKKVIKIPEELITDSFILTKDYFPY